MQVLQEHQELTVLQKICESLESKEFQFSKIVF